jgi:predicted Zn-dependent protease
MRYCVLMSCIAAMAYGQAPGLTAKERAVSEKLGQDIERQSARINDPALNDYLQRIGNRIALAAGANPLNVRVTASSLQTASLLPNGVLYISGGLLERMESEAELAGFPVRAGHCLRE